MTDWAAVIYKIAPAAKPQIVAMIADHADREFAKRNIRSIRRQASFLAHACVETWNFTKLEEDLNYSAQRLCKVWPKRFRSFQEANQYAHNPRKLAIRVYGDRLGNRPGTEDGWTFRGQGILQLTGRENVEKLARELGLTTEEAVQWLVDPAHALECACAVYNMHNVGPAADAGNMTLQTKRLNGGKNGLDERQKAYNRAMRALSAQTAPKVVDRTRGEEADSDAALDNVSVDDLRKAGSRTISGANKVKNAVVGLFSSGGTAVAALGEVKDTTKDVATQVQDTVTTAADIVEGVKTHETLLQLLQHNWPIVLLIIATLAGAFFAWLAWRGAHQVIEARVDDARTGANIGR